MSWPELPVTVQLVTLVICEALNFIVLANEAVAVRVLYVPYTMVCVVPLPALKSTVPPHVLFADKGVVETLWVLIVPLLVILVTAKSYVTISKMLEPVVKVVAVIAPATVSVPLVLLKVKVL